MSERSEAREQSTRNDGTNERIEMKRDGMNEERVNEIDLNENEGESGGETGRGDGVERDEHSK